MKLRIPARVADNLLSSQAAYMPESDPEMAQVLYLLRKGNTRKDGSTHIEINSTDLLETLRIYVDAMAAGAAGDAHDPDGLADLNAARAVLRALNTNQLGA